MGIQHRHSPGDNVGESCEHIASIVKRLTELHPDKQVLTDVGYREDKRSLAQNRFLWPMFAEVAKHMSRAAKRIYTDQDAHDYLLCKRYGQVETKMRDLTFVRPAKGTSDMTVQECTDFIEWCLAWCAERGWPVMMPAEYAQWAEENR